MASSCRPVYHASPVPAMQGAIRLVPDSANRGRSSRDSRNPGQVRPSTPFARAGGIRCDRPRSRVTRFAPLSRTLAATAASAAWFDAGIAGYESWPTDGSDLAVAGQGTWTGTTNATLDAQAHALSVATRGEAQLAFAAAGAARTTTRSTRCASSSAAPTAWAASRPRCSRATTPAGRRPAPTTSSTCAARRTSPGRTKAAAARRSSTRSSAATRRARWATSTRAAATTTSSSTASTGASTSRRSEATSTSPNPTRAATRSTGT